VDLVQRAGDLKPLLTDFALSSRFDREFSAVLERHFPDRVVTDESVFSMVLDQFLLQHRLPDRPALPAPLRGTPAQPLRAHAPRPADLSTAER
jgi:hypothetical protein